MRIRVNANQVSRSLKDKRIYWKGYFVDCTLCLLKQSICIRNCIFHAKVMNFHQSLSKICLNWFPYQRLVMQIVFRISKLLEKICFPKLCHSNHRRTLWNSSILTKILWFYHYNYVNNEDNYVNNNYFKHNCV